MQNIPNHRKYNVGSSDYAKHATQPWQIWYEYGLNPWDADIVKRILRTKEGDSRKLDYQKIIHICEERIAQLDGVYDTTEPVEPAKAKTVHEYEYAVNWATLNIDKEV